MEYTVDYFISKFSVIPKDKWVKGTLERDGKHCALGHCGVTSTVEATAEAQALAELFVHLGIKCGRDKDESDWFFYMVYPVNDRGRKEYGHLKHPKQRILAALRDIKKLSKERDVQECDATRPIVVPSVWPNKQSSFTNLIPIVEEVSDTPIKELNQISQ